MRFSGRLRVTRAAGPSCADEHRGAGGNRAHDPDDTPVGSRHVLARRRDDSRGGVSRTELDPTSFLHRSATIHPDRVAVVYGEQRRTYAELRERVNRLASALRARGLERHDRVAALCPNVPELLELHHAVPAAGGVLVAINVRLSAAEIGYILEHSGSRVLFVDRELEPLAAEAPDGIEVVRLGDEYEELVASGDPAGVPSLLRDEEEPIAIDYTSGTTGRPKGVVYTYRGAYLNALGEVIEAELGHHPVYLWTLPMFHCNGWCFPWAVTAAAGTHVCLRAVDPELIWRLFREEGVTHYNGSPTVQTALVHHPDAGAARAPGDGAGRRRAAVADAARPHGGAQHPDRARLRADRDLRPAHRVHVAGRLGRSCRREERARLLARQGQGYTTADLVRVVDDEMRDVPRDGATMGEVVMRGNNVMAGYFADEEATETRSAAAGSTPATSPSGIRTTRSSCATAART